MWICLLPLLIGWQRKDLAPWSEILIKASCDLVLLLYLSLVLFFLCVELKTYLQYSTTSPCIGNKCPGVQYSSQTSEVTVQFQNPVCRMPEAWLHSSSTSHLMIRYCARLFLRLATNDSRGSNNWRKRPEGNSYNINSYKIKLEWLCEYMYMLREITENKPAKIENWWESEVVFWK